MEIIIDIEGGIPIFAQLIEQIKQAVLSDGIAPGEALPSIRQLASDLEINNKTVAKAYRLLELDSVIQTKGYRGTFIHPEAKNNCDVNLTELINAKLMATIEILRKAGATDAETSSAFANLMNNNANQGD